MNAIEQTEINEETKLIKKQIQETKAELKKLAAEQKSEKELLRTPHDRLPQIEITLRSGTKYQCGGIDRASRLQMSTLDRAYIITRLHIKYNKLRGKPTDMHEYKKK